MSVLIKKMGMPKRCVDCEKISGESYQCPLTSPSPKKDWMVEITQKRIVECPLIEVPVPHGRLIDADELKKNRINLYGTTDVVLMVDIENAPTIIEAERSEE